MLETSTPLFRTDCLGATIADVQVFPTHITYQQKWWRDITVAGHMIASVESHVYEHGFVILTTTSRRRIICTVHPKRAAALYRAILKVQGREERVSGTFRIDPLAEHVRFREADTSGSP